MKKRNLAPILAVLVLPSVALAARADFRATLSGPCYRQGVVFTRRHHNRKEMALNAAFLPETVCAFWVGLLPKMGLVMRAASRMMKLDS